MPYNDNSHHVVKTSAQWDERAIEFWVVPRGCLCVELTPEGKTKIKIGEGNKFYSQLPYVNDMSDLDNYYTKEEVDNIVTNINLMAIRSTDEYDTKNDLPTGGNKLGDVRFVKSSSPSVKTDPDVYLWNGSRWIYVGYELQDIDLSQYLKKDEFHELFDPVREKVEEMYPKMHTHENKNILDRIEEPYSTAEKEKLAGLENYDDTEIRELIAETGHTHPNKPVLDTITDDSLWSESDRTKFESLHNYDDTGVKNRLTDLESAAHTHSNKNILDQVTAAFTVEDKTKLDSLHNNEVFIGTDGMYGGREGLVPAPTIIDAGKFLCADGTWKPATGESYVEFIGATSSEDGEHGLVPAPLAGDENKFLRGDGTWQTVSSRTQYQAGAGIDIQQGVSESYHIVEYLESKLSDRSQAIDTGYKKTQNFGMLNIQLKWRLINEPTASANVVTSHEPGDAPVTGCIAISARKGTGMSYFAPCAMIFTSDGWSGSTSFQYDPNNQDATILRTDVCGWDDDGDISINGEAGPYHIDTGAVWKNIFLFDNVPARIYFCRIFDNDTLVRDLVPCVRDSDNIQGFYDRVGKVFYPNPFDQPTSTDYISGPETGEVVYDFTHESESDPYIITNKGIIDADYDSQNLELTLTRDDSSLTIPVADTVYTAGENIIITGEREEFTKLEYIQGKGNQNINTHKRIRSGHGKFAVDFQFVHQPESEKNRRYEFIIATKYVGNAMPVGSPIIGFARTGSGGSYGTMGGIVNGTNSFSWYWINSSSTTDRTNVNVEYFPDTKIGINGAVYSPDNWPVINDGELYLFGTSDYKCWAKLYSVKIWDDDVLIFDGIPVKRNSDNEVGIFDKCNNEFFINDLGGGALGFKAGPVESGADPVYGNYVGRTKTISAVSYTLPIASDDTLGGVKVGDGLEIDEEGVLSAPGGTQYQAGEGIEIEPVPELIDQHFDYTDYINTVQGVEHGSIVKNNNDSFTITSTANDAYTYPYNPGYGALYTMNVEPNTKYRLTMDLSDWTVDSYVNVFKNQTTAYYWRADMPGDPYLEFTTESNTTVIAFRFGVTYSGHTQTFSNIKLYQVSESTTADSISVKLGTGLIFDANNAIELDNAIRIKLNCNNEPD